MRTLEARKSQNKKSKNRLIALIIVVILMVVGIVLLLTQSTWISAELGQSKAQYTLGLDYYQKKNYTKAQSWLVKASNQKNADAENTLGVMYLNGLGVKKDVQKATDFFQSSAEQGNKFAAEHLGRSTILDKG
ncbi:hypothetical protein GCM10017706_26460 [Lactococcus lactis subsp. hordniae]